MPHDPYKALYLHIPFCVKRCGYCDFATRAVPRDDGRIDAYVESLVMEVRRQAKRGELAEIETLDNLFAKGVIADALTYLESLPDSALRNKRALIEKLRERGMTDAVQDM